MRKTFVLFLCLLVVESAFAQNYIARQGENGLWGYVSKEGDFVISPSYDNAEDFDDGLGKVMQKKKAFFIDATGKVITDKYTWIDSFDDYGLCKINNGGSVDDNGSISGGSFGFIDRKGNEVVKPIYEYLGDFNSYGLALVGDGCKIEDDGVPSGGKFGYIDRCGKTVIPVNYSFVGDFDDSGMCWVNEGGKVFKSDKSVEEQLQQFSLKEKDPVKIARKREELEYPFTGGKRDVFGRKPQDGLFGMYSSDGNVVIPIKYLKVVTFREGMCKVETKNGWGFVNDKAEEIVPCHNGNCSEFFSEGMAWISKYDKKSKMSLSAYVNRYGKQVTDFKYAKAFNYRNGRAIASVKTYVDKQIGNKTIKQAVIKFVVVDYDGKEICDLKYDAISERGNLFLCRYAGKNLLMDRNGKEITPAVIMDAGLFKGDLMRVRISNADAALIQKGGKLESSGNTAKDKGCWVLVDSLGTVRSEAYSRIEIFSDGVYVVSKDKKGAIDSIGNEIVPLVYAKLNNFTDGYASAMNSDGKWGFIDKSNNVKVPFEYDDASKELYKQVGALKAGDKWGAVSMQGVKIVNPTLESSREVFLLLYSSFLDTGVRVLNQRDIDIYIARKKGYNSRFSLNDVILDEYWDF